jgi:hypothetical protein
VSDDNVFRLVQPGAFDDQPIEILAPLFRELSEMRDLWTTLARMGNERLRAVLGAEPHTPLDVAVRKI